MQRRDGEPKVYGPYEHGDQWRVHVVVRRGRKRETTYQTYSTRALAEAFIAGARDQAQGITVSYAIQAFLARKRELGRTDATIESAEDRLMMVLGPLATRSLRSVAGKGVELYAAAQVYPPGHRRAGKRRADDTHRNALSVCKDWSAWCVKQRWLRADPFAEVEPVGRKVLGADKPRLTVDESRKLDAYCRAHPTDPGAVLTLGYLLLGPRASELVRRDVRDLDDGGKLLWIGKTKTAKGRRRLLVPEELRVLLLQFAKDRPSDAPLFVSAESRRWPAGRRWTRNMAYNHVRRICAAAGVPVLSPQAMRRTQATLATDAGATGLMVAEHLGHESPAITHRAYIEPSAARDAQIERASQVIAGGSGGRFRGNNRGNRSVPAGC